MNLNSNCLQGEIVSSVLFTDVIFIILWKFNLGMHPSSNIMDLILTAYKIQRWKFFIMTWWSCKADFKL